MTESALYLHWKVPNITDISIIVQSKMDYAIWNGEETYTFWKRSLPISFLYRVV